MYDLFVKLVVQVYDLSDRTYNYLNINIILNPTILKTDLG